MIIATVAVATDTRLRRPYRLHLTRVDDSLGLQREHPTYDEYYCRLDMSEADCFNVYTVFTRHLESDTTAFLVSSRQLRACTSFTC